MITWIDLLDRESEKIYSEGQCDQIKVSFQIIHRCGPILIGGMTNATLGISSLVLAGDISSFFVQKQITLQGYTSGTQASGQGHTAIEVVEPRPMVLSRW